MTRTTLSTVYAFVFAVCLVLPAGAQECSQCLKPLWQSASIFVVEIDAVDQVLTPVSGADNIRAHATRILKDDPGKALELQAFEAHLRRYDRPMGEPELYQWDAYQLRSGQQFLIFADSKEGGLAAMLASPRDIVPLTGEDDPVGDVALILDTLRLPLSARAQAVAAAVTTSPKPHCQTLARYISSLLVSGSDSETSELQSALENAPASAFSDGGQGALLDVLSIDTALALQSQHRNLASLFAKLAARYFLAEPEGAGRRPLSSAQNSLLQFVHSMATFDPARAAVRALPPELARQFAQKAAEIASDARIQPDFRAMAAELYALIEAKE
jgi:hypothetical protein